MTKMSRLKGVIVLGAAILISNGAKGQTPTDERGECQEVTNAETPNLIELLGRPRENLKTPCIVKAIEQLGSRKSSAATTVLVNYLDFERKVPYLPGRPAVNRLSWLGERFPAVSALYEIGPAATPAILDTIGSTKTSAIAAENAVWTLVYMFSENPLTTVRLLKDANRQSRDTASRELFLAAARSSVAKCADSIRRQCEMVLWDQSGKK